ncbi:nuclear polyadenylated RNA-binding protein Nab2 [Plectosphaerella plurivora]|uniref:Nuclear polyadenylated RNA-binding protein Nab2 n=1 Tax=Plectosphaerella plurivora TaxID=936078 RepID=A0A9P8VFY4_9PEZI|nr:nuclear polyadenylated RNA-binding protein Nab2 [Plectosphaerella plurivora]
MASDGAAEAAMLAAIQNKLIEAGLAQSTDAPGLAEYIIMCLQSGKNQAEVTHELCQELLGLPDGDPTATQFVAWLFEQAKAMSGGEPEQPAGVTFTGTDNAAATDAPSGEMDMDMGAGTSELNAPTGPRSMRNGNNSSNPRGGRDKRMMNQIGKAMDRTTDPLHRTRGNNDRINSHNRGLPNGPRGGGRGGRGGGMNPRQVNSIQNGLGGMGGMPNMGGPGWFPGGAQPNSVDLMALMQQQSEMMAQMQQQLMAGNNFNNQRNGGKSLFDRTQNPRHKNRQQHQNNRPEGAEGATPGAEGEDVDMAAKREPLNPEDTVCKFNLRCTNRECKFAHQSPVAPPGSHVDVSDVCSFGAACKNRKCTGRHPSPATKAAHQSEMDCKFFPNCTNPHCPFKHPDMPLCRNGANCTTAGCKFTHVKTKCRFNPCKNPHCIFVHEDGQQGVFKDKVWTAEGGEHVSERKFVEEGQPEEVILTTQDDSAMDGTGQSHELIT